MECNKANRLARVNAATPASDASSLSSMGSKSSRGDGQKSGAGQYLSHRLASQLVLVRVVRKGIKGSPENTVDPNVIRQIK